MYDRLIYASRAVGSPDEAALVELLQVSRDRNASDDVTGMLVYAERSFMQLKDVTIYTFLIPILGDDSVAKARTIWCSRNNAQVWRTWMLQGVMPPRPMGSCDVKALDRNLDMAERYHLNYTPAIIFDDGSKFAGNADLDHLTRRLDEVAAAATKKG